MKETGPTNPMPSTRRTSTTARRDAVCCTRLSCATTVDVFDSPVIQGLAMNFVVLFVAVISALASIGVAVWTWHVMGSVGDELRDLAGFAPMPGED
jgi:hypothetical protein